MSSYDFPGDDTPIVTGSALKALEGEESEMGTQSVLKLIDEMDAYIPQPERDTDKPFPAADRGRVLDFGSWHGGDRAN